MAESRVGDWGQLELLAALQRDRILSKVRNLVRAVQVLQTRDTSLLAWGVRLLNRAIIRIQVA